MHESPHDRPKGREFYQGSGFSNVQGRGADAVRSAAAHLQEAKSQVALKGNLFEPVVTADFPGAPTWLPVNWLVFPDRKLDYCLIKMQPGTDWPLHVHGYGEEVYVIIAGEGEVTLGDQTYGATRHDVFHIPAGTPHAMVNRSDSEEFCILAINAPAIAPELRSAYWAAPPTDDRASSPEWQADGEQAVKTEPEPHLQGSETR